MGIEIGEPEVQRKTKYRVVKTAHEEKRHCGKKGQENQSNRKRATTPALGDLFGMSVRMSNNDWTCIIGSQGENSNKGAFYVFKTEDGNTWVFFFRTICLVTFVSLSFCFFR